MAAEPHPPVPFVVGVGRSGTTLLRLMLDAHRDLAIPHHTGFLPAAAKRCAEAADPWTTFVNTVTSHLHWADFGLDAAEFEQRVSAIRPFDLGGAVRTFYELYAARFSKPRWGDKTPSYIHSLELVERVLPEARFVHLIRDGRDVAVSAAHQREVSGRPFSYRSLAKRWSRGVEEARFWGARVRFYLEVRYEDLVLRSEATLLELCRFLELPWDPAMLDYHRRAATRLAEIVTFDPSNARSVEQRVARHELTSRPPETSRIGRWRTELSATNRREYESVAAPLLESLGYGVGSRGKEVNRV